MLSEFDPVASLEDDKAMREIFNCIDESRSFVLDAGAGSGKTYALVQTLAHIGKTQGAMLERNDQKVACITYTNVAANEIQDRLGRSDWVQVSTIHDFLWPRIARFQKELLEIHREKIEEEIAKLKEKTSGENTLAGYTESDISELVSRLEEKKNEFYHIYDLKASEARKQLMCLLDGLPNLESLLSNISIFRNWGSKLLRIRSYESCLSSMNSEERDFTHVNYDPTRNSDRLERMRFSHDTLLEYSLRLFKAYPAACVLVTDVFPIILVDEYQDTANPVIDILKLFEANARTKERSFVVGYYGDSAQNIYPTGVGSNLPQTHDGLHGIRKKYNRRSCSAIIDAANRIRNDDCVQKSIYLDSGGGTIEAFYQPSISNGEVARFIDRTARELRANPDAPLHCFVLTNKAIAEFFGFSELYDAVRKTSYFARHYDLLSSELVANEPSKLNHALRVLYDICRLIDKVNDDSAVLRSILQDDEATRAKMPISATRKAIEAIRSFGDLNQTGSMADYLCAFSQKANQNDDSAKAMRAIARTITGLDDLSYDEVETILIETLAATRSDESEDALEAEQISAILTIELDVFRQWYLQVSGKKEAINAQSPSVRFHTWHGTKGEEYDSVLLIAGSKTGNRKNKFPDLFKSLDPATQASNEEEVEEARNLMYVATTRAKKHLRLLYIDDVSDFRNGIEYAFGCSVEMVQR